jgi:hypothetical protein
MEAAAHCNAGFAYARIFGKLCCMFGFVYGRPFLLKGKFGGQPSCFMVFFKVCSVCSTLF